MAIIWPLDGIGWKGMSQREENKMGDIDKMPLNCHDCPYWEIAESPYSCFRCEEIMRYMQNEHKNGQTHVDVDK